MQIQWGSQVSSTKSSGAVTKEKEKKKDSH
jgi:hypothetical protein